MLHPESHSTNLIY